ncbi:hypothetical protein BHM03_00036128 [Ensete ventricosum]|nr:hypothetical protein BHM03_00036128 [Ensete ventricosum]
MEIRSSGEEALAFPIGKRVGEVAIDEEDIGDVESKEKQKKRWPGDCVGVIGSKGRRQQHREERPASVEQQDGDAVVGGPVSGWRAIRTTIDVTAGGEEWLAVAIEEKSKAAVKKAG